MNVKNDFPILKRKVNGKRLVYLDSAATSQKPKQVIEAIEKYYETSNANVHRGIHELSSEATMMHEASRELVSRFVNSENDGTIFVRNATEAINLVAFSWAKNNLKRGDEIISSVMEHHSNIVPWQLLKGIKVKYVGLKDDGTLDIEEYSKLITKKTKLVTITHVSNVLGTINNVRKIGKIAHENNAKFLIDAAQSVPHMPVDFKKIDADFMAFSGHKMLGPSGIGVLCAKTELLKEMPPFMGGGDMIKEVTLKKSKWNQLPYKFEAGTPNIEGAIGLGAAVDYLQNIGMENVRKHEIELTKYALKKLKDVEIYGPKDLKIRGGVISFNIKDVHAHDVAGIVNEFGVAIRSGHHCAQPLIESFGVDSAARASFYIYNDKKDIDALVNSLEKVKEVFK